MKYGKTIKYAIFLAAGITIGLIISGSLPTGASLISPDSREIREFENKHSDGQNHTDANSTDAWCAEHWQPEASCVKCRPQLIAEFERQGDWCGEHGFPESQCRKCNPELKLPGEPQSTQTLSYSGTEEISVYFPANDPSCVPQQSLIQFTSAETISRIGLQVEPVITAKAIGTAEAPAELVYDHTKSHAITTTIPTTVIRWLIEPGQYIEEGQILAELLSPDMAELKADYLTSVSNWKLAKIQNDRAKILFDGNLISSAEFQESDAQMQIVQSNMQGILGRLYAAGFTETERTLLENEQKVDPNWNLRAIKAGALLERKAPLGELLQEGSTLAVLGQPDELWVEAHVREKDLPKFQNHMKVDFSIDGEEILRANGEIIWVAQFLDPETRTGLVRARITSSTGNLKAQMFGRLKLIAEPSEKAVLVVKDAVQWEGCCHIVFVQEAADRFRPRKVTIGRGDNRHYVATSGLNAGEFVVSDGSYLLKSELKKESLGIGCAGE